MSTEDHRACIEFIRGKFAEDDIEVTVSDQPPLVRGPWTMPGFVCPHGVTLHAEPTGEQKARWSQERRP